VQSCLAVNWWERSANYNNATNFCNVNTNGNANNNNASNSNGLAPDFLLAHRSQDMTLEKRRTASRHYAKTEPVTTGDGRCLHGTE